MKMMIKPKVDNITDLQIMQSVINKTPRIKFLEEHLFEMHEITDIISLSFYLRDRVRAYISMESGVNHEASIQFILDIHEAIFINLRRDDLKSTASTKLDKLREWLAENSNPLFVATAVYFIKHFEGPIQQKAVFDY